MDVLLQFCCCLQMFQLLYLLTSIWTGSAKHRQFCHSVTSAKRNNPALILTSDLTNLSKLNKCYIKPTGGSLVTGIKFHRQRNDLQLRLVSIHRCVCGFFFSWRPRQIQVKCGWEEASSAAVFQLVLGGMWFRQFVVLDSGSLRWSVFTVALGSEWVSQHWSDAISLGVSSFLLAFGTLEIFFRIVL